MRGTFRIGWVLAVAAGFAASGAASADPLQDQAKALFGVPPAVAESSSNPVTPEKVELGRKLYYDKRLSKGQDISCNSCHMLDRYGVDGEPTSPGHMGQRGDRNSPTVYYAGFHIAQFWDGRAPDVEEQAKGPVLNPVEMAMPDEATVVSTLRSIPGYEPLFAAAFPDSGQPITYDHMAKAIGAFERKLVTPSPFDRYLEGDANALSAEEKQGLQEFISLGCPSCHNGPLVGGSSYQKLGLLDAYPTEDPGRMKVTGRPEDEHVFKVPSLRNVAKTGPWFHDGSVTGLDMAVRVMARFQLGRTITSEQAASVVTFLNALTGELPAEYIAEPTLPESGPDTPKPDPS